MRRTNKQVKWLNKFAARALLTDTFVTRQNHVSLLAAGMFGEAGSVITELKKEQREREAYPAYSHRMVEEIGDFLWYYIRIVNVCDPELLNMLRVEAKPSLRIFRKKSLPLFLRFGSTTGLVVSLVANKTDPGLLRSALQDLWNLLLKVGQIADVKLEVAAATNIEKIESRWPENRIYFPLFDAAFKEEEQFPRRLEIEFRQRIQNKRKVVHLRCNGVNFGDRLTDNILDPDGYRFHDIFHFSYVVHLGWSPVVRDLLRCKRKSKARIDEAEDGARSAILEEAVSAIVFSRAKEMRLFRGRKQIDYDLLKTISGFIQGYEVEKVPLWQWEQAILEGYSVFRLLLKNNGGIITWDLDSRTLTFKKSPIQKPSLLQRRL